MGWQEEIYEWARVQGGRWYQVAGMQPAGRAKHRPKRQDVIKELDLFLQQGQRILDQDTAGAGVEAMDKLAISTHGIAEQGYNKAVTPMIIRIEEMRMQGTPEALKAAERLEHRMHNDLYPVADPLPRVETNRIPDTQYVYLAADIDALRIRLSGAMRHGQPYMEDFEDALKDFYDSLKVNIGSNKAGSGRFHTRRADVHRDTILDLTALRWVDRGIPMRTAFQSVISDRHAHSFKEYQEWEDVVRGMAVARDKLWEEYKYRIEESYDQLIQGIPIATPKGMIAPYQMSENDLRLYGPGSHMPVYNNLDLPEGKSWEVLAKLYSDIQYSGPGGPNWGENMRKIWEDTPGGAFGYLPSPQRAQRDIIVHGSGSGANRTYAAGFGRKQLPAPQPQAEQASETPSPEVSPQQVSQPERPAKDPNYGKSPGGYQDVFDKYKNRRTPPDQDGPGGRG